jgi:hypothetical protein
MPSKLDPHVALIEGWLAAEPQLTDRMLLFADWSGWSSASRRTMARGRLPLPLLGLFGGASNNGTSRKIFGWAM